MDNNTYEETFKEWQQLVCYQKEQILEDNGWDWEMELQEFAEDPKKALDKAKLIFTPDTDEDHMEDNND